MRFTADTCEPFVHALSESLGLVPVGWIIARPSRSGEKYGGEVILTGEEVRQASRLQWRYRLSGGDPSLNDRSRFVTVVMNRLYFLN